MRPDRLDRVAFLAFSAMLWVCVAAVAGLIVYSFAGLAAGVIAAVVASLVVVALASAMFGADSRK